MAARGRWLFGGWLSLFVPGVVLPVAAAGFCFDKSASGTRLPS
jgi:hypothetical protein